MKFPLVLTTVLAIAIAVEANQKCGITSECGDEECCVSSSNWRKGDCRPLSSEGDDCREKDDHGGSWFGKKYYACPCTEGLVCEPESVQETFWGKTKINERCISKGTTGEEETTTAEEETTTVEEETTTAEEETTTVEEETTTTEEPEEEE